MRKMCSQIENIISAYKTLSKIPSVLDGRLNNAGNRITSTWVIKNLDKGKPTKYEDSYVLDEKFNVISKSDFGVDISNVLISAVSPREQFKAVIREEKESKEKKRQFLEIWSQCSLKHSVDLTALDQHGDVYADFRCVPHPTPTTVCVAMFGALSWSPDETSVAYIAEKKVKKSEPYIKRKGEEKDKKCEGSGEDVPEKGEEYVYRQDWGEQFVGKCLSVVVVCRVESETFTVLEGLPETWCPGQVSFTPDGKGVVGVAYETEPRRLGLVFCTNRPSYVFELSLDGACSKISPEGSAVQAPQFGPNGDLIWLQRAADGPHHACHAIMAKRNGTSEEKMTVSDIVQTERQISGGKKYYGMYSHNLPERAFSKDGGRIVFSTPQQTELRAYVLDIDGGRMVDISNNKKVPQSTSVLDVRNDVILAVCSSLTGPARLYVAKLPPPGQECEIQWVCVSAPLPVPEAVSAATVEYLHLTHQGSQDSVKSFTALYISPKVEENQKLPLIVFPHGGPHSGYVNAFSALMAHFTMLGFATVQVNFRGSTGAGQASEQFILKRIGDADVKDCVLATEEVLKKYPIDTKKLCLFGGSHGGFLVCHLSGQYPDMYCAVVARNPVTDVAAMFNSTDIADWCAVEAGFQFTEKGPVSEEELLAMRRCSPMAHVHKVKAPTAMLLGSGDRRVPPYQGLEYARRLKANGVKTKIYWYDDNHSLSSTNVDMDVSINTARWFFEHTSTATSALGYMAAVI